MCDASDPAPSEPTKWAVSLLTLFAATTLAAIAAAPASWFGANYVASAVASLGLLAAVSVALRFGKTAIVLVPCLFGIVGSAFLLSSGLFFQAVGTVVICFVTTGMPSRVGVRIGACALLMLVAYVPMVQGAIASDRAIDRMRQAYPIVSIRDRLPQVDAPDLTPVTLSAEQDAALKALDDRGPSWNSYRLQLERLHQDSYKRFARAPGFGFVRMGPVTEPGLGSRASGAGSTT